MRDCMIRDISDTGVRLVVPGGLASDQFALFDGGIVERRCVVIWRIGNWSALGSKSRRRLVASLRHDNSRPYRPCVGRFRSTLNGRRSVAPHQPAWLARSSASAALPMRVASDIVSKNSDCRTGLLFPAS